MMVRPLRIAEPGEYVALNVFPWDADDEAWRILPVTATDEKGLVTEIEVDGVRTPLDTYQHGLCYLFVQGTFPDDAPFRAAMERVWDSEDALRQHLRPHIRPDYTTWIEEENERRRAALDQADLAKTPHEGSSE